MPGLRAGFPLSAHGDPLVPFDRRHRRPTTDPARARFDDSGSKRIAHITIAAAPSRPKAAESCFHAANRPKIRAFTRRMARGRARSALGVQLRELNPAGRPYQANLCLPAAALRLGRPMVGYAPLHRARRTVQRPSPRARGRSDRKLRKREFGRGRHDRACRFPRLIRRTAAARPWRSAARGSRPAS
jgi:hypothetical protein